MGNYYRGIDPNAPGAKNPFGSATLSAAPVQRSGGFGAPTPRQAAAFSPAPSQGLPSSRISGYNPLLDPTGPFARSTKLGALLSGFYSGPTRAEHLASQQRQQGADVSTAAAQAVASRAAVVGPQQAILEFSQSPLGNQFMQNNGDWEWLGGVAAAAVSKQTAERRAAALTPPPEQPAAGEDADPWTGMRRAGEAPPSQRTGGFTPIQYVDAARELYAAGDTEGGDMALKLAEEARQVAEMGTTDDIKEYNLYVQQEVKAGRQPMEFMPWLKEIKPLGAEKTTMILEGPGLEAAKLEARIKADTPIVQQASETALKGRRALGLLKEAERVAQSAPGGYAGVVTPYLARIASSFGIKVPETWGDSEMLYSISMQMVELVRQPGQVSNFEQVAYMRALPALAQSTEGRLKIVDMMRKQIERGEEIAKVMRANIGEVDLWDKVAALDEKVFDDRETEFLSRFNTYLDKGGKMDDPAARALVDEFLGEPTGANPDFAPQGETFTHKGTTYRSKGGERDEAGTWEKVEPEAPETPKVEVPTLKGPTVPDEDRYRFGFVPEGTPFRIP